MNDWTFEEFLTTYAPDIEIGPFLLDLLLSAVLAYLVGAFYVRFGRSLSNRTSLAGNFVMIGMTTMLIISVVKSSLALSLGLVGALSIVRFRTAVKEPEELAYLFLTIAVGLGLGASQRVITIVAVGVILAVLWLRSRSRRQDTQQNLFLTVTSEGAEKVPLEEVVALLEPHCSELHLRRYDENNGTAEAMFEAHFDDYTQLDSATKVLRERNKSLRFNYLHGEGVY